jgi:hypothetical protein
MKLDAQLFQENKVSDAAAAAADFVQLQCFPNTQSNPTTFIHGHKVNTGKLRVIVECPTRWFPSVSSVSVPHLTSISDALRNDVGDDGFSVATAGDDDDSHQLTIDDINTQLGEIEELVSVDFLEGNLHEFPQNKKKARNAEDDLGSHSENEGTDAAAVYASIRSQLNAEFGMSSSPSSSSSRMDSLGGRGNKIKRKSRKIKKLLVSKKKWRRCGKMKKTMRGVARRNTMKKLK